MTPNPHISQHEKFQWLSIMLRKRSRSLVYKVLNDLNPRYFSPHSVLWVWGAIVGVMVVYHVGGWSPGVFQEQECLLAKIQPLSLELIPVFTEHLLCVIVLIPCTHVYLIRSKCLSQRMAHISLQFTLWCFNWLLGNILATRGPHCFLCSLKGAQILVVRNHPLGSEGSWSVWPKWVFWTFCWKYFYSHCIVLHWKQ